LKISRKLPQVQSWDDLVSLCSQGTRSYEELSDISVPMTLMPFGKHGGKRFTEIPTDYLKWLLRQADLSKPVKLAAELELANR
jgi:uncharacterized protein (DUF3820 family)